MKQVVCPKCGKEFAFDESRYDDSCHISFICPGCRKRFVMSLDEIAATEGGDIDASHGYITVLENAFGYRQEFPLHPGDNLIGRASKGTEVDIAIETSDMSMDRRHCIIHVKEKGGAPATHSARQPQPHRHLPAQHAAGRPGAGPAPRRRRGVDRGRHLHRPHSRRRGGGRLSRITP